MNDFFSALRKELLAGKRNDTVEVIRSALAKKILQERGDFSLPRIHQLADALHVCNQSVRKAYYLLGQAGMIERPEGSKLWRCIRQQRSGIFAMIIQESFLSFIRPGNIHHQYKSVMYSGLVDRAMELGYSVAPVTLPPPDADDETIAGTLKYLRNSYRGVIHIGSRSMADDRMLLALLKDRSIPQLTFNCKLYNSDIPAVMLDENQTVEGVIHYLRSFNHRHFAVVWANNKRNAIGENIYASSLLDDEKIIRDRFERVRQGDIRIIYCGIDIDENFNRNLEKEVRRIFTSPERPGAVWCRQFHVAYRVVNILHTMGLRVPEDVSVMYLGYLMLDASNQFPALSLMRIQTYEIGRSVIDHFRFMEQQSPGTVIPDKLISTILVARDSVAEYCGDDIRNAE